MIYPEAIANLNSLAGCKDINDTEFALIPFIVGETVMILNGDFETGSLINWSSIGQASVSNGQAIITNDYGSAPDSVVENFLNLNIGTLDGLVDPFKATTGSAIESSAFEVKAGKIMSFNWEFITNEAVGSSTYNDFSFFSIDSLSDADPANAYLLADTNGPFGSQTSTYNFKADGYYQVGFGVMNQTDTVVTSQLLLDNVKILNTDFETGDFSDWNIFGNTSVQGNYEGIDPLEGQYQAVLSNSTGSLSDADIESKLGLSTGALDILIGADATEGSAIQLTPIDVQAGETLSFQFNFLTNEYPGYYNDFAFISIVDQSGSAVDLQLIDSVNLGSTSNLFEYTFATAGTFTVGIGVMDVGDTSVDSTLLVDNLLLL